MPTGLLMVIHSRSVKHLPMEILMRLLMRLAKPMDFLKH
jgi:hypothetical protein